MSDSNFSQPEARVFGLIVSQVPQQRPLPVSQHSVSLLWMRFCRCSLNDCALSLRPATACSVRSSKERASPVCPPAPLEKKAFSNTSWSWWGSSPGSSCMVAMMWGLSSGARPGAESEGTCDWPGGGRKRAGLEKDGVLACWGPEGRWKRYPEEGWGRGLKICMEAGSRLLKSSAFWRPGGGVKGQR